jgi:hypothetical protein
MRSVLVIVGLLLAVAHTAAAQSAADRYRGGWRSDDADLHVYEFSIRGERVRGIYCTLCSDATTLAFVDGTLGADGLTFVVTHVRPDGRTEYQDKATARIEGDRLIVIGTSGAPRGGKFQRTLYRDPRGPDPLPVPVSWLPDASGKLVELAPIGGRAGRRGPRYRRSCCWSRSASRSSSGRTWTGGRWWWRGSRRPRLAAAWTLEESADPRRRRGRVDRIRNWREQAVLHLPPCWKPSARDGVRTLRQPLYPGRARRHRDHGGYVALQDPSRRLGRLSDPSVRQVGHCAHRCQRAACRLRNPDRGRWPRCHRDATDRERNHAHRADRYRGHENNDSRPNR